MRMDAAHFEKSDIQSFMQIINEHTRAVADTIFAARLGAFPRRYIAGIDSPPPPGVPCPSTTVSIPITVNKIARSYNYQKETAP